MLHYDANNNGAFDPADDPPIGGRANPDHAVRFPVRKADRPIYVLAEGEHALRTNASVVVIRRTAVPKNGYLVIRTAINDTPGKVVGQRSLTAGVHEDVAVALAEHFYHHQPERFTLYAMVYAGDGDGRFGDGDLPARVNGTPVASRFTVERTGELDPGHEHTPTTTKTAQRTTTARDDHDHEHTHTLEPTATPSPTAAADTTTGTDEPTSTPGQPGFGATVVVIAFSLLGVGHRLRGVLTGSKE